MRRVVLSLIGSAVVLTAGSPARAASLKEASEVLGTTKLDSLEFTASGRWYQFGQAPNPSSPWPPFELSRYVADINFAQSSSRVQITRLQVVEPGRVRPAPVEQKLEQSISGTAAWNLAPPPNAATPLTVTPQPLAVEERAAEIWSTPQGFVRAALANHAGAKRVNGGVEVSFVLDRTHRYVGIINAKNQVERIQTWIDNPVLGDTLVETTYSDYRDFGGLQFPGHIARTQGGFPVLELTVSDARANPSVEVPVPQEVASAKSPAVVVTTLADGVFYLTGGTHHSVAVDQGEHIVVIEAPLSEERSLAVIAKVKETIPNKPIKYLVNTHAHFDHLGGVRTYVAEGATIVTQQGNEAYYRKIWAAPHTISPDRLAKEKKAPRFLTFTDTLSLSSAKHPVELHAIAASGHNDAFALAYLPAEKVLVEADAYTPAAADAPAPKTPNPYSVNLYDNVKRLGLEVERIAALHGPRVVTLADLRLAIGQPVASK